MKIVAGLFDRVGINTRKARTLVQFRDMLLPKLITGEIRVRDAEKAVETTL